MHEQPLTPMTGIHAYSGQASAFCAAHPVLKLLQVLADHAGLTSLWRCCCAQVHLFIFYMAITHILGGILLIVLAALRIRFWKRWTEHSDHVALE